MKEKGITLIALVITIIVLIILAGVSINLLLGDNGLIKQIKNAGEKNTEGDEKEKIKLSYMTAKISEKETQVTTEELQKELDKYTGTGKSEITDNGDGTLNVKFYDSNNHYTVNKGNVEQSLAKITNKKIILSNSTQEIIFSKTISQEDVNEIAGKNQASYEIIGVASTEDGEYTTLAEGKTGKLEIQGDSKNATFKYTLTDFMQGDETFFVKYTIDGVEQTKQKLEVIQADAVTYEEDFVKFEYEGGEVLEELNENFSNGKAMKMVSSETSTPIVKFDFLGSAIDFVTAIKKEEQAIHCIEIYNSEGNLIHRVPATYDTESEDFEYNIKFPHININSNDTCSFILQLIPSRDYSQDIMPPPIITTYLYLDAIIIHK